MTVAENLAAGLGKRSRREKAETVARMVERFRLSGLEDRYPRQLSGGQQQRVSIGRALYNRPAIVLADEPTGNLDRKNGAEIIRLLKESNQNQKQTLLLITHDESIALQADRMISIEDGRITRDERIRMSGGDRR